jgi:hypothetical protein
MQLCGRCNGSQYDDMCVEHVLSCLQIYMVRGFLMFKMQIYQERGIHTSIHTYITLQQLLHRYVSKVGGLA